ncbi:bacteriohemerythrin [Maridesulfovibrio sp.]|uniref:bacteriohemerythrin n=1 Tax=Maridesulfovibrio sp. TaxID=2795000 RepID=UPI0029F4A732|nr:bacteriohemerythrin [Maridesulfovibrio sp.]
MAFVVWKDSYSLGNELIDEQHKSLIVMLNDLAEAGSDNVDGESSSYIIRMVNYAREHFCAEEKIMKEKNYPNLDKHISEHTEFIEKVVEFQKAADNDRVPLQELLEFLNNWLVGHILTSDQKFVDYIRSA